MGCEMSYDFRIIMDRRNVRSRVDMACTDMAILEHTVVSYGGRVYRRSRLLENATKEHSMISPREKEAVFLGRRHCVCIQ